MMSLGRSTILGWPRSSRLRRPCASRPGYFAPASGFLPVARDTMSPLIWNSPASPMRHFTPCVRAPTVYSHVAQPVAGDHAARLGQAIYLDQRPRPRGRTAPTSGEWARRQSAPRASRRPESSAAHGTPASSWRQSHSRSPRLHAARGFRPGLAGQRRHGKQRAAQTHRFSATMLMACIFPRCAARPEHGGRHLARSSCTVRMDSPS